MSTLCPTRSCHDDLPFWRKWVEAKTDDRKLGTSVQSNVRDVAHGRLLPSRPHWHSAQQQHRGESISSQPRFPRGAIWLTQTNASQCPGRGSNPHGAEAPEGLRLSPRFRLVPVSEERSAGNRCVSTGRSRG